MTFEINKIYQGDSLEILKTFLDESIDCVVTSPPYWGLRDYGIEGQLGLENTHEEHIDKICNLFNEIKRVLKSTGTCWVNYGDSYLCQQGKGFNGNKRLDSKNLKVSVNRTKSIPQKCLAQIPFRFSIEMCNRGWILRNVIVWQKPNAMPESVKDRFTVDFEYIFFFVKSQKYYFQQQFESFKSNCNPADYDGFRHNRGPYINRNGPVNNSNRGYKTKENIEGPQPPNRHGKDINYYPEGRNMRTIWTIPTQGFPEAHFATFPEELPRRCIKAGCPPGGLVLDPFAGSGTTLAVAKELGRNYLGIELNPNYIKLAEKRIENTVRQEKLFEVA